MAGQEFDRRSAMRWTAGAASALALGTRGAAQQPDKIDLFGLEVPAELGKLGFLKKPLDYARTISAILELERDADARGLPVSSFAMRDGPELTTDDASFYTAAMPRLVALIDRSEGADPALADRSGELLSQVNASQHSVPDALKPGTTPPKMSRARDFASLKDEYTRLFDSIAVRAEHEKMLAWYADVVAKSKPKYEKVASELGVPWHFIGVIHGLEASFNFRAHLHNGDFPLTQRTRQVPAGRPIVWMPPSDWASSAKDAIRLLGFAHQSDWSLARTLHRLEAYNGFGYRRQGVPTPYLWSYSTHYDRGKFVADGSWSATARSRQCGAAVLIKALADAKVVTLA